MNKRQIKKEVIGCLCAAIYSVLGWDVVGYMHEEDGVTEAQWDLAVAEIYAELYRRSL